MLREDGAFIQPEEAKDDLERMREIAAPIIPFANKRLIFEDGASTELESLHAAYKTWCAQAGHKPMSQTKFGTAITDAFPNVKVRRPGARGSQTWIVEGVRLREVADNDAARDDDLPDDPMELRAGNVRRFPMKGRVA